MNDTTGQPLHIDVDRHAPRDHVDESRSVSIPKPYLNWLHIKSWLFGVTVMVIAPNLLDGVMAIVPARIISLILGLSLMQRQRSSDRSAGRMREFGFNLSGIVIAFLIRYLMGASRP